MMHHIIFIIIISCLLLAGIARLRGLTMPFRILLGLQAFSVFMEILSWRSETREYTTALYHLRAPIELTIYSGFCYTLYKPKSISSSITVWATMLILPISLLNSFFIQPISQFPSYIMITGTLLLLFYSLAVFHHILASYSQVTLSKIPEFWWAAGSLIFNTISYMYIIFMGILLSIFPLQYFNTLSYIHLYITIGLHSFYSISIVMSFYEKKENKKGKLPLNIPV